MTPEQMEMIKELFRNIRALINVIPLEAEKRAEIEQKFSYGIRRAGISLHEIYAEDPSGSSNFIPDTYQHLRDFNDERLNSEELDAVALAWVIKRDWEALDKEEYSIPKKIGILIRLYEPLSGYIEGYMLEFLNGVTQTDQISLVTRVK